MPYNHIEGTEFDDQLWGDFEDDHISGYEGDDYLYGEAGDDLLEGGEGHDDTSGGYGNDIIDAGAGDDWSFGDEGDDLFLEYAGNGEDEVTGGEGIDTLQFMDLNPEDVQVTRTLNDLMFRVDGAIEVMVIGNYGSESPDGIEYISFADGTVWSLEDALDNVVLLPSTEGHDWLWGTAGDEVIDGLGGDDDIGGDGGNDTLLGGEGDDLLWGGEGEDRLEGGLGYDFLEGGADNDLYVYRSGEDWDQVKDSAGTADRLLFADVLLQDINATRSVYGVEFSVNGGGGIFVEPGDDSIEWLEFADGTLLSFEDALAQLLAPPIGTEFDDVLWGTAGDDTIDGLGGSDLIGGDNGNDYLIGGAGSDELDGGAGDDVLIGDAGEDYLNGGAGNDVLIGGVDSDRYSALGNDVIIDVGGDHDVLDIGDELGMDFEWTASLAGDYMVVNVTGSDDQVYIYWDWASDAIIEQLNFEVEDNSWFAYGPEWVEFLAANIQGTEGDDVLTGTASRDIILGLDGADEIDGGDANDSLYGDYGNDTLLGGQGNDRLHGGEGTDSMAGGTGNDIYIVDSSEDIVIEAAGEGIDRVVSSVSYTLGEHLENLSLTIGEGLIGTGNAADNVLRAEWGAQILIGGQGNDSYYVEAETTVIEAENEGIDTVYARENYTLGENVEYLILSGYAANGTGNSGDNVLIGNDYDNVLDGSGGADYMVGGYGDDTYGVNDAGDSVIETAEGGYDTVGASISYVLPEYVEALFLMDGAADGVGNALDNQLDGNDGDNILAGLEGDDEISGWAGNDVLAGGAGDDFVQGQEGDDYVLGEAGNDYLFGGTGLDVLAGGSGNDLMKGRADADVLLGEAGIDIALAEGGDDTLYDTDGTGLLSGGEGNDFIVSSDQADFLIGGAGDDLIYGGDGADVFAFNAGSGVDILMATPGSGKTLSLGAGTSYDTLALAINDDNLVLYHGSDVILLADWYADPANQGVDTLQVIAAGLDGFELGGANSLLDQNVEWFDFGALVDAFDAARALDPSLNYWAFGSELELYASGGADDAAIGGDLAYQYGVYGDLANVGNEAAVAILEGLSGSTQSFLSPDNLGAGQYTLA